MRSYGIALLVITPLMMFLLGSFRLGLVAMIPNLFPILLTLGLMGWTGTLDPDVRWQFHSDGQYNFSHYSSQKLDELLEQGVSVAATTERKQFYDKFQVQLLEEAPIVPLYRPLQLMAADKRLHNASGIPTQEGLLRNIEQWWVGGGE